MIFRNRLNLTGIIFLIILLCLQTVNAQQDEIFQIATFPVSGYVHDVKVIGDFAYVTCSGITPGYSGTLKILDVSKPYNPVQISSYDFNALLSSSAAIYPSGLYVKDGYVYIANWTGGLVVINIMDIHNPFFAGSYFAHNEAFATAMNSMVVIDDNYLYVTWDYVNGFGVFDLTDPTDPVLVFRYGYGLNYTRGISKSGDYIYISTYYGNYIRIFNVSNPTAPVFVKNFATPGRDWYNDIDASGDYLYVAGFKSTVYGLQIYDIKDPENPLPASKYNTASFGFGLCYDVKVYSNRAYLVFPNGVAVFDVTDPYNPELIAKLSILVSTYYIDKIDVSGNYFYVAAENELKIFSLKTIKLIYPEDDASINDITPTFKWEIPGEENKKSLHFKIEIAEDENFATIAGVYESKDMGTGFMPMTPVVPGEGTQFYTMLKNLKYDTPYFWRVSARKGQEYYIQSPVWEFKIQQ